MVQSYQDHPRFSMEGSRVEDSVTITGTVTNKDMISNDHHIIRKVTPPIINRVLCEVEGTMQHHKIIHNKIIAHQDKERTQVLFQ